MVRSVITTETLRRLLFSKSCLTQCCLRNYTSDHNSEKREKGEGNRAGKFPVCCLQFCYLTLNCHFFTKRLLNLLVTAPTRCTKMCWVSVKRDLVAHHISASAVICAVAIIKSQMHLWFNVAIQMTTNKKLQCRNTKDMVINTVPKFNYHLNVIAEMETHQSRWLFPIFCCLILLSLCEL